MVSGCQVCFAGIDGTWRSWSLCLIFGELLWVLWVFAIFTIYEKLFNLTSCSLNPTLEQYLYLCFFSHILITLVHCVTKKERCQLSTITVVKLLQTCECFCLVGKNQFLFPNSSCCLVVCVLRCRACAAVLHVWCAAAVRSAGTRRWPESSTLPSCYWGPLLPASCCHQVWIISSNGYESNMETRSFLHARYNSFWPSETNTNIHQAVSHPTTAEVPLSKAPTTNRSAVCVCPLCVYMLTYGWVKGREGFPLRD